MDLCHVSIYERIAYGQGYIYISLDMQIFLLKILTCTRQLIQTALMQLMQSELLLNVSIQGHHEEAELDEMHDA